VYGVLNTFAFGIEVNEAIAKRVDARMGSRISPPGNVSSTGGGSAS
jgi:hypothetical protein